MGNVNVSVASYWRAAYDPAVSAIAGLWSALLAALVSVLLVAPGCGSQAEAPTFTPSTSTEAGIEATATTGAIPRASLPVVEFIRGDGSVVRLPVEVPLPAEYGIGLSGRRQLDERGMLFYFRDPNQASGFWMKDTHIDLSIAFVTADFRVVDVREMRAESTDVIHPGVPYQYGIEAPAGWYRDHNVRAGDRMRLTFELPAGVRQG